MCCAINISFNTAESYALKKKKVIIFPLQNYFFTYVMHHILSSWLQYSSGVNQNKSAKAHLLILTYMQKSWA